MNALLHRYPETRRVPRAGIVHRLDKDTTGLLVVARTPEAHTRLVAMMAAREIRREYDAVVNGAVIAGGQRRRADRPPSARPRAHGGDRRRPGGADPLPRHRTLSPPHAPAPAVGHRGARTRSACTWPTWAFPVTGDTTYGGDVGRGKGMDPGLRATILGLKRQALHAAELALVHPMTGEKWAWQAPWPDDLTAMVARPARRRRPAAGSVKRRRLTRSCRWRRRAVRPSPGESRSSGEGPWRLDKCLT